MTHPTQMLDLHVLQSLDGHWVSFAVLKVRLESICHILNTNEPDALACIWRSLESFEAEGWIETSERIHGSNVIEYRLSPIGLQKQAQFRGI